MRESAPSVVPDGLAVVRHDEQADGVARELSQQVGLDRRQVLALVDQNAPVQRLEVFENPGILVEQVSQAQQHAREVDGSLGPHGGTVRVRELLQRNPAITVSLAAIARPAPVTGSMSVDGPEHLPHGTATISDPIATESDRLEVAGDDRGPIDIVAEHHYVRSNADLRSISPQPVECEAVNRVRVQPPQLIRYGLTCTPLQFFGCLDGECHHENAECFAGAAFECADDALDQHLGLSAAGRRHNQHFAADRGDGAFLVRGERTRGSLAHGASTPGGLARYTRQAFELSSQLNHGLR